MKPKKIILFLAIFMLFFASGCVTMADVVKEGDTVKVNYKGSLENGTVFDSSEGREPLEFTVGTGQVIEGFDKGVLGMKVGETKTVTIPPEKAYGEINEGLIQELPIEEGMDVSELEEGSTVQLMSVQGPILAKVVSISESHITVDLNHELAGKTLVFEIALVEIVR